MRKTNIGFIFALYLLLGSAAAAFCSDSRYYDPSAVPTLVAPASSTGITYYVDGKTGSDSNNGLTPTTAFQTVGKAADRYSNRMKGGNTIKIRAGLYRERVVLANITGNTDEQHRFTIGPYGDGEVIIDGSDTHTLVWSQSAENPNIWVASCNLKISGVTKPPTAVVMDDNFKQCRPVYQLADVNQYGRWWYDAANLLLYVYTGGASPTAHDVIVVTEDRDSVQYGVKADLQNFVTVYGLTVRGAGSFGIWLTGNNSLAEKNYSKYNGKTGIFVKGNYGKIVKNKTYGNVLLNWPRGKTWDSSGGWPNGGITSGNYGYVSGNLVDANGGEGIGCYNGLGSIVVEDNISSNNWSANIYLDSQPNDIVRRNLVCNDYYDPSEAIDASRVPAWTSIDKIRKRMIPNGIMMGDETASSGGATNYQIYDNVIINAFLGISHYEQRTESGVINSTIANNTIIMPDSWVSPSGTFIGFELINKNNFNSNSFFINNVIVGSQPDAALVHIGAGATTGVTFNNNFYYAPNSATPFLLGSSPYTQYSLANYQKATGLDWNSVAADPMFAAVGDKLNPDFYLPVPGSPLIGMAALNSLFSTDFNNYSRPAQWSIGALEPDSAYIGSAADTTPPTTSISSPAAGATVTDTVSVTAMASDNVGITSVEFYVNGALQQTGTSAPYTFSWNTNGLTGGSYNLTTKAHDAAGNIGESAAVTVTIPTTDTIAPTVSLVAPLNNSTVSGVSAVTASASDNVGVTRVDFYLDGSIKASTNLAPYSFNWDTTTAVYGYHTLTAKAYDAAGNLAQYSVGVTVSNDLIAPTMTSFSMPSASTSLTVQVSSLSANDNIGVTGYYISESSATPTGSASGWSTTAPPSFAFAGVGTRIAYVWAKDAVGNISAPVSAAVIITLPVADWQVDPGADYLSVVGDNTAVSMVSTNQLGQSFTLANSGNIHSITVMLATSGSGGNAVLRWGTSRNLSTSYLGEVKAPVTNTNFAPVEFVIPSADAVTAGTVYYFALTSDTSNYNGSLYVRRKNAGSYANGAAFYGSNWNVASTDGTRDTLFQVKTVANAADVTAPTVNSLVMPSSANALTVPIVSLTATDNVGVSGYFLSEDATTPSAATGQWTVVPPSSFTFVGAGVRTLNVWAKDAAGNVSTRFTISITIVPLDTMEPSLTAFTMPATANGFAVAVSSLTAGDNVGVTGYQISESSIAPAADDANWSTEAPTSFTFSGTGTRRAYAWAKDAAGNVSASRSAVVVIDMTLPVIKNVSLNKGNSSINIKASAADNIAVTSMRIYVDGNLLKESEGGSVSAVWQVTYSGNHVITVRAADLAGNVRMQSLSMVR